MTALLERLEPSEVQLRSVLGRTSPLVKLAVALGWLVGLALTVRLLPPAFVTIAVLLAGRLLGGVPWAKLFAGVAPTESAIGRRGDEIARRRCAPRRNPKLGLRSIRQSTSPLIPIDIDLRLRNVRASRRR